MAIWGIWGIWAIRQPQRAQAGNPNERKPAASKIDELHAALDKELPEMLTAFRRIEIASQ